jgi:hypothetical protein
MIHDIIRIPYNFKKKLKILKLQNLRNLYKHRNILLHPSSKVKSTNLLYIPVLRVPHSQVVSNRNKGQGLNIIQVLGPLHSRSTF